MEALRKTSETKPWPLLFLSLVCIASLGYILLTFPPGLAFIVFGFPIPYLLIFFSLLFLSLYGLVAFFLKSALQGILVGVCVCLLLIFRLVNLTHPFFTILLCILFLCIEAIVWKRK